MKPDDYTAINSWEGSLDLIQRLGNGDTAAIEELYSLYFDRIYSMVYNQVGRNHTNAEDIVQEAWLAVVKSAKKFKGQSQPYTWLYKIVWYKIKDFQRRHYREITNLQQVSSCSAMPELEVIDTEPIPEEVIEREETRELVRNAVSALPGHYQQILTLKYLENMSAREIGQVMGKSTKSVESLLDRARLALRENIVQVNK
jgi:RNA polymerase sigma-70 factor (ECF subfamily)